jgi:hypothetical protein
MSLTEVIDQFTEKPPVEPLIAIYNCPQDSYDIYYSPSLGEATYMFKNGEQLDVNHLTKGQVAYFEKSGYWKRL